MESWNLLLEIVVLLGACLVLGAICSKLRQSPLVGYLTAGMFLGGPGSLRVVHSDHDIEAIAELGVALLLFSLGLEFSWRRLLSLGSKTLLCGGIQVVVTAVVGTLVSLGFQLPLKEAVAVGAMLSLSSTAAVLRVLMDRGDIDSQHARNSVAILLVQDMAVVPLAVLMTLLSQGGTPSEVVLSLGKILGLAFGLIAVLYVLLNQVAVRALRWLGAEQNRELPVVLAVVVGLGATWAAHAIGLSPALGAFLAGMFLGSSPFAVQLRSDVSSLRTVLLTLFFGAVGMVADPFWIARHLHHVLAVASLILALKTTVVWGILKAVGQPQSIALATGLCLSQVGEFAFVLGSAGRDGGVVSEDVYMVVVSSTIATLFFTPYFVTLAPSAAGWLERRRGTVAKSASPTDSDHPAPDVVIVGFGPAGQAIGRALAGKEFRVVVLDVNPQASRIAQSLGFDGQIGDATQLDVLEHAHVASAKLVAITLPARSPAMTVLQHVKRIAPKAHVVVRSRYELHEADFEAAGADAVIGDEEQVGYRLSNYVRLHFALQADTTESSGTA